MIRASRTSYSPESRVRTSSASTAFWTLASSTSASASESASPSSLAELDHDLEVVDAAAELGDPVDLALERGEPAGDARGVGLVVPQVGRRDLLAEVGDLARACASRSSTCSIVLIVAWSCLISVSKSGPATRVKVTGQVLALLLRKIPFCAA